MDVGCPAAGSSPVLLSAAAAAANRAESVAAAPQEACGVLFGRVGAIVEATAARNVAAEPRTRFEIDPAYLFDAHRRGRAGPLALIGCWHSHPIGRAVPSAADAAGVGDRGWLWLIVAGGEIAGFVPEGDGFRAVALVAAAD